MMHHNLFNFNSVFLDTLYISVSSCNGPTSSSIRNRPVQKDIFLFSQKHQSDSCEEFIVSENIHMEDSD